MRVHILQHYHLHGFHEKLDRSQIDSNYLWGSRPHLFFHNAKAAIHHLARLYSLERHDEVCIFTSSDKNYVSTCVSATFFNYCKISRVITDKTKFLYIIHEFGLPHPEINNLVTIGREHNLITIEDCAHSTDSVVNGQRVGTFADYAIYSLPKLFPLNSGGVLVGPQLIDIYNYYDCIKSEDIKQSLSSVLPLLPYLSRKRKEHFHVIRDAFPDLLVSHECDDTWTPYFIIFLSANYEYIMKSLEASGVECGITHVKDWLCIPTQPLMTRNDIDYIIAQLRRLLQ